MRTIALISMLGLAVACGGEPEATEPPAVEIVHSGTGTGSSLAISTTKGHDETLAVEVSLHATGQVNGEDSPDAAIAPLTFSVGFEVTEVSERAIRADISVDQLAVGEAGDDSKLGAFAYQRLSRAIKRMPKLGGEIVVSPTGFISKLELNAEKGVSNQQRQVVELVRATVAQLMLPRPGVLKSAGKWQTEVELNRNGFAVAQAQEATFEQDGSIRLTFEETIPDDLNSVSPPGVYADSVAVDDYTGGGSGRVFFDPALVFPREAFLELSAKTAVTLEQAGRTDEVVSKARLTVKAKSE